MKVFISQPMNGRSDEEILNERREIVEIYEEIHGETLEVIDSFIKSPEDIAKGRIWMLGGSIQLMKDAELVIFAPGYNMARGCIVEEAVCKQYGLKHMYFLSKSKKFIWGCASFGGAR
jgi:hypothetical protein